MKVGVMQPYYFPYIGYWQLMNIVDVYVIFDDVNYINRGWINRNRVLNNGQPMYFNIGLMGASQNKLINQIEINPDKKLVEKNIKTIQMLYSKAPYFNEAFPIIKSILELDENNLAIYLKKSFDILSEYLDIKTKFVLSSQIEKDNSKKGQEKIIEICNKLNATEYYNAIGGQELYDYDRFEQENIHLFFVKPNLVEYKQFNNEFIPGLSIIDVMMFNDKTTIKEMLNNYELINNYYLSDDKKVRKR